MEYNRTLSCAQEWALHGRLEDWVHAYLLSDGRNKPFSDGLKLEKRIYLGPLRMPLQLFIRISGPEKDLPYPVPEDAWERHVGNLMDAIQRDPDMPPLIVHYMIPEGQNDGIFELNDGNNRWEAYTRLGIEESNVIIWITSHDECEQFCERYGQYLA